MHKIIWYGRAPSGADVEIHLDTDGPISAAAAAIDRDLTTLKFTASERFARPSYGGGPGKQKRPDLAPPPGIIVPQHCGEPMKYIRYKKDGAPGHEGRGVPLGEADMFVCRKDKQCEDVTSGKSDRAHATFDMKAEAKAEAKAEKRPPLAERILTPAEPLHGAPAVTTAAPGEPADRPMTAEEWAAFWTKVREMKFSREDVFSVAADVLTGQGPAMKDTEFTRLGKVAVHRIFIALKEVREAELAAS